MEQLNDYTHKLLSGWEDVHNQGQLSLWILLSLKDGAKYMGLIKEFIVDATHQILVPDDKSVYRALRRFRDAGLIKYELLPTTGGPDRKMYSLTEAGALVLQTFLERNIIGILYQPKIRKLIEKG